MDSGPWEVSNICLLFFVAEGMGYLPFVAPIVLGLLLGGRVSGAGVVLATVGLPSIVAASFLLANY